MFRSSLCDLLRLMSGKLIPALQFDVAILEEFLQLQSYRPGPDFESGDRVRGQEYHAEHDLSGRWRRPGLSLKISDNCQ